MLTFEQTNKLASEPNTHSLYPSPNLPLAYSAFSHPGFYFPASGGARSIFQVKGSRSSVSYSSVSSLVFHTPTLLLLQ